MTALHRCSLLSFLLLLGLIFCPTEAYLSINNKRRRRRTTRALWHTLYHHSSRKTITTTPLLETTNHKQDSVALIPLSRQPLLFESSRPLLTLEQCELLMHYFQGHLPNNNHYAQQEDHRQQEAEALLDSIQLQIDQLTASPRHPGEPERPRYLEYPPTTLQDSNPSREDYLPDGLHVDTNNAKYFRHITVLLYLTDNPDGGATTFPLANNHPESTSTTTSTTSTTTTNNPVVAAAHDLIRHNVWHTRKQQDETTTTRTHCQLLEQAAVELMTTTNHNPVVGRRVLARRGYACVFYNLDQQGMPDAYSFHGGEANTSGQTKALLAYFKELNAKDFADSIHHFRLCATRARQTWIDLRGSDNTTGNAEANT